MSASKSNYPERPIGGKRPSQPGVQRKKPAREHIHARRKSWMSLGDVIVGNMDMSPRRNFPWWKAPMYKDARAKKWSR
jgi:hypothetical protein